MKKINKSFADRAKLLIKKYSRSDFDKNERAELDAALQKLSEEQELYKQVNKIGEYSDEAMQQKAMQQQQLLAQQQAQQSQMQSPGQLPQGSPQGQSMQPDSQVGQIIGQQQTIPQFDGISGTSNIDESNPYVENDIYSQPEYQFKSKGQDQVLGQTQSILPSVIAGGIGMLGNIALGATTKERPFDFKQRYNAEQISLAKERERLNREAIVARNIGMRNLSGAGSRGAYLAGAGNVSAGINQQLADALSKSYMNEGVTNMAQREKAYDKNFDLEKQIALANYQAKVNADNERRGYYAAAAQIPSQTMADIGQINAQNTALLSSGTDNYLAGVSGKPNMWKNQQIYRKFKKS